MVKNLTDRIFIGNIIEIGDEIEECPEDFPKKECDSGSSMGSSLGSVGVGDIGDLGSFSQVSSSETYA